MANPWVPVTEVVKQACTFERNRLGEPRTIPAEAFERWLAKVKAEGWDEGWVAREEQTGNFETLLNPYSDLPGDDARSRIEQETNRG